MVSEISWLNLSWCLLPLLVTWFIYKRWHDNPRELLIAGSRMVFQLILVGYGLVLIFDNSSPWYSGIIIITMMLIAAWIAIRPVLQYSGVFLPAAFALFVSVSFHLFISLKGVMQVDVWYEPRIIIPLSGMYFANCMNALSLAAERFYSEINNGEKAVYAKRNAFRIAMIPQINSLLAVGLVALPGMMTGQILSGVSPLIAVRYQIMIMAMILGSSVMGIMLLLWQISRTPVKQ